MVNRTLQQMRAGRPALGAGARLGSLLAVEALARAGFDLVLVDAQHGAWDEERAMCAFRAIHAAGATPMVRVPGNDFAIIGRYLDAGALGIIVPMVNSAADARTAAFAARYPPRGGRSWGPFGAEFYGPEYAQQVDEQLFLAVQIETAEAVQHAAEILGVPGVDGCWIGPNDLARSMGADTGTTAGAAALEQAIAQVLAACRQTGKIPGIAAGGTAKQRLAQGFLFVVAGRDDEYLLQRAQQVAKELRLACPPAGGRADN